MCMGVRPSVGAWEISQPWRKLTPLSSRSHYLPIIPWLGIGIPELLLIQTRILAGLILSRSCACSRSCYEFVNAKTPSCWQTVSMKTSTCGSYRLSAPLQWWSLSLVGTRNNIDVPFRTEHPTVSCSLYVNYCEFLYQSTAKIGVSDESQETQ